jgi:hypothetical protein
MFELREAKDARHAVGGALRVRDVEALDPEDVDAASGEVEGRRAPHAADPEDDDVVVVIAVHRQ